MRHEVESWLTAPERRPDSSCSSLGGFGRARNDPSRGKSREDPWNHFTCTLKPPPLVCVGVVKTKELDVKGKETVAQVAVVESVAVAEAATGVADGEPG